MQRGQKAERDVRLGFDILDCDFSWGGVRKCLVTPGRAPVTDKETILSKY